MLARPDYLGMEENMANRIVLNTISYHGAGAIAEIPGELQRRGYKKVFVCTDPDLVKFGVAAKVTDLLDEAGIAYSVYSDIKPNPTIQNVTDGVEAYQAAEADSIVTIGGGSAMDTAKAIGVIITNPEFADVRSLDGVAPTKNHAVFTIAVPTTAGTAAEVTINYVITDVEKVRKFVCVDTNDAPEVAVVDPEMMATMPAGLTASTGMDALTHAIEGYTTKGAWEMSDMFHLKAIELIAKNLRDAVAEAKSGVPGSGREGMALAQYIAGMGFSNVGLGVDHSMAHTLSAHFDTPHGVACAMLLPIAMEFNKPVVAERLAQVAVAMGVDTAGMSTDEAADAAIAAVKQLSVDVNIPTVCEAITEDELDTLTRDAMADACFPGNPREATYDDVMGMFRQIMK
jgi:lactaldehyde reductase